MNCKLIVLLIMFAAALPVFAASQEPFANTGRETEETAYHRRYGPEPKRWHDPFGVYWKEARPVDFVYLMPAQVGAGIFSTVGFIVLWPGKLIWSTCNGDFSDEALFPPIDFSQRYFGIVGCYVLASPFWALEKALWDGPVWIYDSMSGSSGIPAIENAAEKQ
ncbi:MAG: hypothetical protein ACYC4Q_06595 [Victivallaceae bacterium]